MKIKIILAFIILITSVKAQDSNAYILGPHGGLLKSVENYKIETLNAYGCITVYLLDGTLKLIPNKFVSGTITFFYNNEVSLSKYLVPFDSDSFTADVNIEGYNYYSIRLKINGKFISTRFNNFFGRASNENRKNGN